MQTPKCNNKFLNVQTLFLGDFSKYTTMTRNDGGTVDLSGWFNLADYILDPEQIIFPQVN